MRFLVERKGMLLACGALLLALLACGAPHPTPGPANTQPCSGEDADCSPRDVSGYDLFVPRGSGAANAPAEVATVETVLEKGLLSAGAAPVQIALRGTAPPNSVRCDWRGIARTPTQREQAIRFWLELDEDDALPSAAEVERRFLAELAPTDSFSPAMPETAKAGFLALARGGESREYMILNCFADYAVHEYLLGAGPTQLTVSYDRMGEARSYDLYTRAHAAGEFGSSPRLTAAEHQNSLDQTLADAASDLASTIGNRESVLFLAPMGAHNAIAVEAWQVVEQWELQTQTTPERKVVAVRYGVPEGHTEHSLPYADLKRRVSAAARTDAFAGKRIANVSGLTQHYRDIGAYGDITPGDGETTTFTPAQTPPHCGLAVGANPNRGLVQDCLALMEGKDTLRGTGSLNWDYGRAIATWDGITVSGTPARVTRLEAQGRKLTGTIPASLGKLSQLTRLYLQDNKLTGSIPPELGDLSNLTHFNLYYNSLSGSIPSELGDLSELRRFYLNSNQLTGSIPSSFGNFSKIWHLYLNDNKLTGSIPSELGRLSTAIHIHLGGNDLSGGVPTWLGNLSRLTWLYLNGNELTGSIPPELGNLSRLLRLSLADNDLSGSIPTQLGNLSKVTHLYLGGNKLTGCVPAALRSVSTNDLSRLSLSNC